MTVIFYGMGFAVTIQAYTESLLALAEPVAFLQDENLPLPSLPDDPAGKGRVVRWFVIASAPGFFDQKGKWWDVNEKWVDAHVSEYERFKGKFGYHAPVRMQHQKHGLRYGDVVQLAKWNDPREFLPDGTPYPEDRRLKLIAALALADVLDPEERIQNSTLKFVSVGIRRITTDTGLMFPEVVGEVSLVDSPHLKSAAPGGHVLAEQEENKEMEERLNQLEEMLKALMAKVEGMIPSEEAPPATGEPPAPSPEEENPEELQEEDKAQMSEDGLVLQLSERILALEQERDKALFEQSFPAGRVLELSEEDRELWFQFSRTKPKAVLALLKKAQVKATPTAENSEEGIDWSKALGKGNAPEPGGEGNPDLAPKSRTIAELKEEAKRTGVTYMDLYKDCVRNKIKVLN